MFTKIDLSRAYQQIELDEESQSLVTISTHKGLFKYKRLCFGVTSAPGLFQREMEKVLNGLEGVVCFFDDILITGQSQSEHNEILRNVLCKLRDCGLTVKQDKCECEKDEVQFIGYVLDRHGTHVSKNKIKALSDAPIPKNETQLRAFLGMALYSYYMPMVWPIIRNSSKITRRLLLHYTSYGKRT